MDRNLLWDVFCETGDIEVYLKYKEQKKEGEEKVKIYHDLSRYYEKYISETPSSVATPVPTMSRDEPYYNHYLPGTGQNFRHNQ